MMGNIIPYEYSRNASVRGSCKIKKTMTIRIYKEITKETIETNKKNEKTSHKKTFMN